MVYSESVNAAIYCLQCDKNPAAASFALCADCLRKYPHPDKLVELHASVRRKFGLPVKPPMSTGGISCTLCSNCCMMGLGESGYCGLRMNKESQLVEKSKKGQGLMHMYLDRLPTNCCAAWFCPGSKENGYNLAVFLYGCSFDCMYCQNSEHKLLETAPVTKVSELVIKALDPRVRCVCFFGGSPEPQFSFVLDAAQKIFDRSEGRIHICWEWNGSGNSKYVKRAAHLSKNSGGTVKFDIKAFHPNVHTALCGRDNTQTLRNFRGVAELFPDDDILTATTLLVPYYVDQVEVNSIAQFISRINSRIPYSLLVFHPDFYLDDLPVTPRKQVFTCYDVAKQYLERVNIGNRQLL